MNNWYMFCVAIGFLLIALAYSTEKPYLNMMLGLFLIVFGIYKVKSLKK